MSESTITVGDKTITVSELTHIIFDRLLGAALTAGEQAKETLKRTIAASKHNDDLLETLEDGTAFRIAFKKQGETEWTRIRVEDEDALQRAALWEIVRRQDGLMENLANLLGVDNLSINI